MSNAASYLRKYDVPEVKEISIGQYGYVRKVASMGDDLAIKDTIRFLLPPNKLPTIKDLIRNRQFEFFEVGRIAFSFRMPIVFADDFPAMYGSSYQVTDPYLPETLSDDDQTNKQLLGDMSTAYRFVKAKRDHIRLKADDKMLADFILPIGGFRCFWAAWTLPQILLWSEAYENRVLLGTLNEAAEPYVRAVREITRSVFPEVMIAAEELYDSYDPRSQESIRADLRQAMERKFSIAMATNDMNNALLTDEEIEAVLQGE